jgi:hypothetical protein
MECTAEQHLQMAKLLRRKAMSLPIGECSSAIKKSNFFLALAAWQSTDRGGLYVADFDFEALVPNWSRIDRRVANLAPIKVDAPSIVPDFSDGV